MPRIKKNILICGYQKSGTTWATRLVAQLLDAPSAGYWKYEGKTFVFEGEERASEFVCYQSHHMLYETIALEGPKIEKVIYIVRDPRDIVVSGVFHFNFYSPWLEDLIRKNAKPAPVMNLLKILNSRFHSKKYKVKRMIMMLQKGDPFIEHCNWPWNDHVLPYLNHKEILIIKYEDLLLSGVTTAKKILVHVGYQKPDKEIISDLRLQSFEVKRRAFKKQNAKIKVKHLRKGVVGDWKNHLSEKEVFLINKNHGQLMHRLGYG
jgi:hypothetical protein